MVKQSCSTEGLVYIADYLYKLEAQALRDEDWKALEVIRAKLFKLDLLFTKRPPLVVVDRRNV